MASFSERQKEELLDQVAKGAGAPECPRCGGACAVLRVGPRDDVAYVRHRIVVRCAGCMRSCVIDAPGLRG